MRVLDSTSAKWPKKIRTDKVSNSFEGKGIFPREEPAKINLEREGFQRKPEDCPRRPLKDFGGKPTFVEVCC